MRVFGDNLPTFTHWFAWTFALVASIFFSYFVIVEDIPHLLKGQNHEMIWFIPFLILGIIGTVWSVWNRIIGGIIMLIGGIGMVIYFYFLSGWKDANMMIAYGLPYVLPGFLLLLVTNRE